MRIHTEEAIVLVIDYQERLMPAIDDQTEIIKKSVMLLEGMRALAVPMIVSQQYPKGLGTTVLPITHAAQTAPCFDKTTFSCADDAAILSALNQSGRKCVIVCGAEAHVCVLQSVIDLCARGFDVVLVVDCIGSRHASDKVIALERAKQEGAWLSTAEAILFELTRQSGTPIFKAISALVK